jgi:catechol 2,3-dioxygenase-like lactoylglutathione lyase family enzyme
MSIFTHVAIGTNDLEKARTFYDSVLGALGLKRIADLGEAGAIWGQDAPSFFVMKPVNGEPATVGNGVTVSFDAPSRAAIDAFHAAALSAGGTDAGLPGTRDWAPNAYAAYVRDLDGNKLTAYCFKDAE